MDIHFIKKIKTFIKGYPVSKVKSLNTSHMLLIRQDGMILINHSLSQEEILDQTQSQSLGALIAGIWSGANAIKKFNIGEGLDSFSLGFNNASTGIYLHPLSHKKLNCFLAFLYKNEINPGNLRYQFQQFTKELELNLGNTSEEPSTRPAPTHAFENLSDEELDQVFTFQGRAHVVN